VALVGLGAIVFAVLKPAPSPPPKEIADDPLLVAGRAAYFDRCVSCHGIGGRGDGPIAKGLTGPPVGDLTDARWKHGDDPEKVRSVISQGVPNTVMPGWGKTLGPAGVDAASAYVYYLAGRPVPESIRERWVDTSPKPRQPKPRPTRPRQ
jgi:mono/diheme cytochrome c family protein